MAHTSTQASRYEVLKKKKGTSGLSDSEREELKQLEVDKRKIC